MKKLITIGLAILSFSALNAQWWGGKKVKGNGNKTTVERSVGNYSEVSVAGSFDVDLIGGKEGNISISAEENLIKHIITEVKNGELIIKTEEGYELKPSYNKGILVVVPFESLDAVSLSGSGDVVSKSTIKTNNFKTSLTGSGDVTLSVEATSVKSSLVGSGDIELSGKTTDYECSISGSGDIDSKGLKAVNVDASISGSGDIEVHCDGMLRARVSGSGDIDYYGNPTKEDSKVSGSGDISKG
ncbi:head GIN domain-containing protein [Galbibacter mesophilus]|uniref:head GIN domain-containing protein n=1 Tax=Galbibacter mesophilus TaxID=379069 RepID=UPI00191D399D|nr:head GIN domain-containing protein [Galbibacter mesophilus]MCM5663110.1 DUF2807 domain-containing protein [Galbibacter mesophilus]